MNKKVSIEEIVNDFLDYYYEFELADLKDNLEYEITNYLEEENIEYSEKEKESFIKLVKKEVDEKINNIKEPEIKHLSTRKSIYEWLSGLFNYMLNKDLEPGDVGFLLSVDEIIDLIAQNGNKE